jgi:hypothetical protein
MPRADFLSDWVSDAACKMGWARWWSLTREVAKEYGVDSAYLGTKGLQVADIVAGAFKRLGTEHDEW